MSDLSFTQSADPVTIVNETTGNQVAVNADGSINISGINVTVPSAVNVTNFVDQGKVFTLSASINMATSGSNNPLVLLKNPSGSGKIIYIYKVSCGINVSNVAGKFVLFKDPTVTNNGTTFTPVNCNIGHANTSISNAYTLSTVSASGTQLLSYQVGQNSNNVTELTDFSIFIQANHSILLTGDPLSNNREANLTLVWAEV